MKETRENELDKTVKAIEEEAKKNHEKVWKEKIKKVLDKLQKMWYNK